MTYKTFDQVNASEGLHTMFSYSAEVVPILPALILISFFLIILLGSFFHQRRSMGTGNLSGSFAVAGFITFSLALVMSLIPNFINLPTLVTSLGVAILGFIWLIFSDRD